MIQSTHTYVEVEISSDVYEEIRPKLKAADYNHCFEIGDKRDGVGHIFFSPGISLQFAFIVAGLIQQDNTERARLQQQPEGGNQ